MSPCSRFQSPKIPNFFVGAQAGVRAGAQAGVRAGDPGSSESRSPSRSRILVNPKRKLHLNSKIKEKTERTCKGGAERPPRRSLHPFCFHFRFRFRFNLRLISVWDLRKSCSCLGSSCSHSCLGSCSHSCLGSCSHSCLRGILLRFGRGRKGLIITRQG